jgi:zinc/manganese transport system substrate-binding protein
MRAILTLVIALLLTTPVWAKPLNTVVSFTVLEDMVHQVGRDRVVVSSLVGPNGDPHAFEPSPQDGRRLKEADLVFVSGLGLEGWMDRLIKASGYHGTIVLASDGIRTRFMDEDGKRIVDPHAWNSAENGIIYVNNIVKALSAADPEGAARYAANGNQYANELRELGTYARQKVATVPSDRRKVLTSHDAFGYFGDAYGVTFLAPVGLSTESEAAASNVAKLIDQIKTEHVKAYFFENSNDPKLIRQIARATGAEPGGELYVEALSKKDGPAPSYAAMFRHNVDLMVAAMKLD